MEARDARAGGIERQGPDGLRMRLGAWPGRPLPKRAVRSASPASGPRSPLMETLRLLVTELVTNSVRHTDCQAFTLRIAVRSRPNPAEDADDGPAASTTRGTRRCSSAPDTGWGLFLVQRLARDWGVKEEGRSKRVWFELGRA